MSRNPGRKKYKHAAKELAYVNKTGTRKSWEQAISRWIREKKVDPDEFLDEVIARCENFRKIEKLYNKTKLWFKDPETGIQSNVDAWVSSFASIFYHKDFYWVQGPDGNIKKQPALPMAMEYGHFTYGTNQLVQNESSKGVFRL